MGGGIGVVLPDFGFVFHAPYGSRADASEDCEAEVDADDAPGENAVAQNGIGFRERAAQDAFETERNLRDEQSDDDFLDISDGDEAPGATRGTEAFHGQPFDKYDEWQVHEHAHGPLHVESEIEPGQEGCDKSEYDADDVCTEAQDGVFSWARSLGAHEDTVMPCKRSHSR